MIHSHLRILRHLISVSLLITLSACESSSQRPAPTLPPTVYADQSIDFLVVAAETAPLDQVDGLLLQLAWAYFSADDLPAAGNTLTRLDSIRLSSQELVHLQTLRVEIAIALDDLESAGLLLGELNLEASGIQVTIARYCAARGDYICAANRLINAADGDSVYNDLIWQYMGLAPGMLAVEETNRTTRDPRGWWQLKTLMLTSTTSTEQQRNLDRWQADWPRHPARKELPAALTAALADTWSPTHAGLALPLSGPLASAGEAVRDGFAAAYLQGEPADFRVSFYDSATQPMPVLYERMLADGVDLLVGPLAKQAVAQLNRLSPQIPVLMLNYLETHVEAAPDVLQLGLAIEDEAVSIARRLANRGASSLLVFHNYEDWSIRARQQLTDSWAGRMTVQSFSDVRTITEAVGDAMAVTASSQRREELSQIFGEELEFLPRARADVDAIVALVDNVEANALVPALRFHFAHNLPVYASSQVIRGARQDDLEGLENFEVSELPWYLHEDPLYQVMETPFSLKNNRFSSLHALGADAFLISQRISTLSRDGSSEMLGSTGALSLTEDGRFHRELAWAIVQQGLLVPLQPEQYESEFATGGP